MMCLVPQMITAMAATLPIGHASLLAAIRLFVAVPCRYDGERSFFQK
jgi:hypothetical protein